MNLIVVTIFACVQPCHVLCNVINQQTVFTRFVSAYLIMISNSNGSLNRTEIHAILKIITALLILPNNSGIR